MAYIVGKQQYPCNSFSFFVGRGGCFILPLSPTDRNPYDSDFFLFRISQAGNLEIREVIKTYFGGLLGLYFMVSVYNKINTTRARLEETRIA